MMNNAGGLLAEEGFRVQMRKGGMLDLPVHDHDEMELSLILNACGARRIVGSHIGEASDVELVLTGPHLAHGWSACQEGRAELLEVDILFRKDIFPPGLLEKNQLFFMRQLFEDAKRGISYSKAVAEQLIPLITGLSEKKGFAAIHGLFSLLHQLSIERDRMMLSDITFTKETYRYKSRRLERAFLYMNMHYDKPITLAEVSRIANMPSASFSRFIKTHTGRTFIDSMNEIRMGHVSRMLVDTTLSIGEIAYCCGFNNLANFNRVFKAKKGLTPKAFKRELSVPLRP